MQSPGPSVTSTPASPQTRAGPTGESSGPIETGSLSGHRVQNVDVLRAGAALAVLGVHAYALGGRAVPVKAQFVYDVPLITLATGVWLFFGISGYVISRPFIAALIDGGEMPRTGAYALRRAARIYPLYWVAVCAVIAIDGTTGTHGWQLPLHYLLLNNLVPGQQEALFSAAWTLALEVLFYAVIPLLAAWLRRSHDGPVAAERVAVVLLASWAASILFTVLADLQGDGQIGLWLRGSLPSMWQMFCPGILLALAPHLSAPRWRDWLVGLPSRRGARAVALVLLLAAALLGAAAPLRFGVVPYQLLVDMSRPLFAVGYGLVIAAAIRAPAWRHGSRLLLELGLVSYGIYLLHPVIESLLLRHGLAPAHRNTIAAFVLNTMTLAALTIPLAILSWHCLELPLIRRAKRAGRLITNAEMQRRVPRSRA